jgi:protein deglycase
VPKILVPLAPGFEETEAVTIIDILRRGGVEVVAAGLEAKAVKGSHALTLEGDALLAEVELKGFDGIVLPGGQPGTTNLMKSTALRRFLVEMDRQQLLIAAICAAPTVLEAAGVLKGKKATCYPGCEKDIRSAILSSDGVVVDGHVVTSRGVGTALAFALTLVKILRGTETYEQVKKAVLA